jgi:hypothetical protein
MTRRSAAGRGAGRSGDRVAGLTRVVSGGQTGADRAALDWAIARGIPYGGWCPRGRKAEDGTIPRRYRLTETPSDTYLQRTEWNVRDSDGTAIFSLAETLTGGSRRTAELARQYGKPWLHLAKDVTGKDAEELLRRFARENHIRVLNVAGPRASAEPMVGEFVRAILDLAFVRSASVRPVTRPSVTASRRQDGEARSRRPSRC